jgi:uncharacterized protein YecA (UPF0149 family)
MNKVKPNDKCNCGSDKKYKKCCFLKDEVLRTLENTYIESDTMKESLEILKENFPELLFKNVTEKLNSKTYQLMLLQHMKDNTCLVSEKFKTNVGLFEDRDSNNNDYDLLIMYRGAYRILHGGANVKLYIISLKTFFENPSIQPNQSEK